MDIRAIKRLLANKKLSAQPAAPANNSAVLAPSDEATIAIPKGYTKPTSGKEDVLARIRDVHEVYPLITTTWNGKKFTVASARIYFNPLANQLVYEINEPQLDDRLRGIINKTISLLQDRLEIEFSKLSARQQVFGYIDKKIDEIWNYMNVKLSDMDIIKAKYYIFRDTVGLGKIEPMMKDPNLEDLACDGIGVPVFIFHRNPLYGEMSTNMSFNTKDELDSFVMKLAQKCGRTISVAAPLLDATLPDGSRLQVTYGTDIARKGSNFSIRKFFKIPLTIVDLLNYQTADPMILAYLWLAIEEQKSILVAGTTAVGKTTFLNSICQFIPPTMKIVSIEDTSELQLMHINWLPQVARVGFGPKRYGEITMFDLLKAALRQRPDYLIVGEVRGSIRGCDEVIIIEDGETKRVPIQSLENKSVENIKVPTLNHSLNISLTKLTNFIKHPARKKLLEITTKTGRKVTVTHDHSMFTATKDFRIIPVECSDLKKGSQIVIPASMPYKYNDIDYINLTKLIPNVRLQGVQKIVKKAISIIGQEKANKICNCIARQYCRNVKNRSIYLNAFEKLLECAKIKYKLTNEKLKDVKIRTTGSDTIPALIPVNEDFCRFLGYYVAEGYYSLKSSKQVVITNSNPKIYNDVISISRKLFGIEPKIRKFKSLGQTVQVQISSAPLAKLIAKLGCGRTSDEKRVPALIYGLSKKKIAAFLRGAYSGDGSFYASKNSGNSIRYFSISKKLAEDMLYLLLTHGIVARIYKRKRSSNFGKNDLWYVEFKQRDAIKTFLNEIGFTHKNPKPIEKGWQHSKVNMVTFNKEELKKQLQYPRKYRHLTRFGKCSKHYLQKVVADSACDASQTIKNFANGQFYLDEVNEIREMELNTPESVYDLSVNPTENFIGGFGGIVLHNSEANVMFHAMSTGHAALSTLHADNLGAVIDRLTTRPINLPLSLLENLDIIVFLEKAKMEGKLVRKVGQIMEIVDYNRDYNQLKTNEAFHWIAARDKFEAENSHILHEIATKLGWSANKINEELLRRAAVLDWMRRKNVHALKEVAQIVNMYFVDPQRLAGMMEG